MNHELRHQARRAKQLAELLRAKWEGVEETYGMDLYDAAVRLSDEAWEGYAAELTELTGKEFRPPSETTKQICIGYLSVPSLEGLMSR